MHWPPLCRHCDTRHVNSCEDAQDARQMWARIEHLFITTPQPRTPMACVPPALRGPRWPAR